MSNKRKAEDGICAYLKSLPGRAEELKLINVKRGDMVFFKAGVFIKVSIMKTTQELDEAYRNAEKLKNDPQPNVMEITMNERLVLPSTKFHVCATPIAGTMFKCLDSNVKFPVQDFLIMARDLLRGVNGLHRVGLAHFDLHRTNFVRDRSTGRWSIIDIDIAQDVDYDPTISYWFPFHAGFPHEHHYLVYKYAKENKDDPNYDGMMQRELVAMVSAMGLQTKDTFRYLDKHQLMVAMILMIWDLRCPIGKSKEAYDFIKARLLGDDRYDAIAHRIIRAILKLIVSTRIYVLSDIGDASRVRRHYDEVLASIAEIGDDIAPHPTFWNSVEDRPLSELAGHLVHKDLVDHVGDSLRHLRTRVRVR